jgi:UDP-2,3-diacylglucosamine pyrophosphatase LpxH
MIRELVRQLYVISDLHLGGAPDPETPGDLDYRIFSRPKELESFVRALAGRPAGGPLTELVINGDFVDFLAERKADGKGWSSFRSDPDEAVKRFRRVVGCEPLIFGALGEFLAAGHRLTLLVGNHDLELSLPTVRRALEEELGVRSGRDCRFLYDGEAYTIGDHVLIEHGNRYDPYNTNDNDGLRRDSLGAIWR